MSAYLQTMSCMAQSGKYIVAMGDSRTASKTGAWGLRHRRGLLMKITRFMVASYGLRESQIANTRPGDRPSLQAGPNGIGFCGYGSLSARRLSS